MRKGKQMDFIFNFVGNFFETIIIMWLVLFVLEKLNVYRIEKKIKFKLILILSIILSIIYSLIDLF